MNLGDVVFVRRGSRTVAFALFALAGVISLLGLSLLVAPPPGNDSPTATALSFVAVGSILAFVGWRTSRRGQWFCRNGFRQKSFLRTLAVPYSDISGVAYEDLVVDYRGHHHTVVITLKVKGVPVKVTLTGKVGPDFSERRDPDADSIIKLLQGAGVDGTTVGATGNVELQRPAQ